MLHDSKFVVYGFKPIRKELRDTPKTEKLGRLGTRNLLLSLYDELTQGRYLKDSIQINRIALKFYSYSVQKEVDYSNEINKKFPT
jgi:hypothetical protein